MKPLRYLLLELISGKLLFVSCRLYSMFMMVGCVQEELNALKQGLNDVIPNELLSGLTAEVRYMVILYS